MAAVPGGGHRQRSDVDLLGVVESRSIHREVTSRGASFYHYPSHTLLSKAKSGDLFILHLVEEGKVLHDTLDFFENLGESFKYKSSYSKSIREAQAVVRFITSRPALLERQKVRKRLIWGLRTIIIARSAEDRNPIFSSRSLEIFSSFEGLKDIIDNRNTVDASNLIEAAQFVDRKFGVKSFDLSWPSNKIHHRKMMSLIGGVAEDTLKFIAKAEVDAIGEADMIEYPF